MSRITQCRVTVLDLPQAEAVSSSYATYRSLGVVVVEVESADGVVGQGWTNLIGGGADAVASFIRSELAPSVIGTDPALVRATWEQMYLQSLSRGRTGVALYAISAVDIAIWDLRCRELGAPLSTVLGACRTSVPVYGDGCWVSYSDRQLREAAESYVDRGFWGVKVKVGADVDDAVRRVRVVGDVVAGHGRLMVDANQRYGLRTAMDLAERLRGEGVVWFEEPMRVDLVDEYTRLCERSPIPIAAGENAYSRYGFRDILERRAVDVLQPDVHRVGGITEFMRVAALAEARDVPVAPHTSWELHTQLLACVATGVAVEYYDWFPDDAWDVRPSIVDGEAVVSSEVGIGAHLSNETLRRYSR